ncbi:MAG: YfhO family protein [Conexibacter sp.]
MGRGTQPQRSAQAAARADRGAHGRARVPTLLRQHPTLAAAALFALVVLAYLWPALLGGKVLSADATLYGLSPWHVYSPANLADFRNVLLGDVPVVVRPWHMLVRELLHAGVLPLWNPHVLTGIPLFQNPQTGLFTPFSLPLWILPFDYAVGVTAALKLGAAALGTYLLVRELRLGFLAGIVAGLSFAFCSMNVTWLMPEAVPAVVVWLPWMIWLVERLLVRGGIGAAIALACVTAAALSGGHPGSQAHVLVAAGLYALLRAGLGRERAPPERWRSAALALGGLALGVGLVGAMLIPELLSAHETVGTLARKGARGDLPGLRHMPFGMIRSPLFPDWWGRPSGFEGVGSPTATMGLNYEERTFYAGVVALLLAAIGLTNRSALRRQAPFLILGGLGLAAALHAPGLWWLLTHLPALELVENQRLHFLFELAVAVLAGFGLQAVLDRPSEHRRQLAVALAGIGVALIAAATAGARWVELLDTLTHFATGRDFEDEGVLALTAIGWFLLFALTVTAGLLAMRRWPQRRTSIAGLLVLAAAFDMLHFAHGYNPMGPRGDVLVPRTPTIAYLQRHRAEGRVTGMGLALLPDAASRFGLDDVRGYDPPFPTVRYFELWRMAEPQQAPHLPLMLPAFTPEGVQVSGALGARFVVVDSGLPEPPRSDPALRSLQLVHGGLDATVYRNRRAAPRAFVPAEVIVVPDAAAARAALVRSDFDASRTVVVERDQRGTEALAGAKGTVEVVADRNARVTLRATLARRSVVVLADQMLDGWSVRVDGRPASPIRVNTVLRGVAVESGTHTIEWSYRVPGLRAGAALSALALAVLTAMSLVAYRRRRGAMPRRR